jgi:hypothetical protein
MRLDNALYGYRGDCGIDSIATSRNMSIAASVAKGLDVAAIPCSAMAADRVGILKSRILAPSLRVKIPTSLLMWAVGDFRSRHR